MGKVYIGTLSPCLFNLYGVQHAKCWAGWFTIYNQDCWEKYQQPQIHRWYFNGRKLRGTKEPLDECERGQWESCLNTQKMKIKASGLITSWEIDGEKVEIVIDFISLGSKITVDSDCSHEIKNHLLLGRKAMTNLDTVLKNRHHFVNKGPSSQSCGFSSSRVWMWELDQKERWAPKNRCFCCGVREDCWESLGLQGDPTSPS